MIRNNWRYKLLALVVAIILWAYVNSERNPQAERTFTVPVEVQNVAKGFTAELSTNEINITIKGLKAAVDAVNREDLHAQIDLSGLSTDRNIVSTILPVTVRILRSADDNDLRETWTPRQLKVRMEATIEKQLPVEVKFGAAPPVGYSYSSPIITPANVNITGRITDVSRVKRAVVLITGDISSRSLNDYLRVIPLNAKGNEVKGVDVNPAKARLELKMTEVPATKVVIVSPVFTGEPRFPAKITHYTVNPSSVTLEGKPNILMNISTVNAEPVSIEDIESSISKEVSLKLPAGARVVGDDKVKVTVFISSQDNEN
jgi:YbbR domain-containing protein